MGECGCYIDVSRCNAHAHDVVLVLGPGEARALKTMLASREGPPNLLLASVLRQVEHGGVPVEGRADVS